MVKEYFDDSGRSKNENSVENQTGKRKPSLNNSQIEHFEISINKSPKNPNRNNLLDEVTNVASSTQIHDDLIGYKLGVNLLSDQLKDTIIPDFKPHLPDLMALSELAKQISAHQTAFRDAHNLAFSGLSKSIAESIKIPALTGISFPNPDIRKHFESLRVHSQIFSNVRVALETSKLFEFSKATNIPNFGFAFEKMKIKPIGAVVAAANAASNLSFSSAFHDDLKLAAAVLSKQALILAQHRNNQAQRAVENDLVSELQSLITRSLMTQDALLQQIESAAKDSRIEVAHNNKIATIDCMVSILSVLLSLIIFINALRNDSDIAVRENTEALIEMQNSFDALALQLVATNNGQYVSEEDQDVADSEIAELLRDTANILSKSTEAEADTESKTGIQQSTNDDD